MKYVTIILKLIVSLTILNVWILRVNKSSIYRGGDSVDLVSEFLSYGLSINIMYTVGTIKLISALLLLLSIFYKKFETVPLIIISILMIGAIYFHYSLGDELIKSLPAATILLMSLVIYFLRPSD
jgi:hypothetical protein